MSIHNLTHKACILSQSPAFSVQFSIPHELQIQALGAAGGYLQSQGKLESCFNPFWILFPAVPMFSSFWWTKDTEGFLWSFVFGLLLFVRISARSFSLNAWFVDNCHGPFIYLQVVEICSLVIFRSLSMQTWDNCNVVIIRKILKVTKHWIWTLLTDILFCFWPHSWSMAFDVPSPYIHLIWPAKGHCVGMVGTSQPT